MKSLVPVLISILLLLGACGPDSSSSRVADLYISGGTIYTMDADQPEVEAVAVSGDKILFAGPDAEGQAYIGSQTRRLDLDGKTLVPGLIESHAHFMGIGYAKLNLDLMETGSYQELIDSVAAAVARTAPGEWILGRGWHQSKWADSQEGWVNGFPVHDALSAVSPDHPVYLTHASGHAGLANAKAMEIAGISAESEFSDEGEILKASDGRPTGIFSEVAQSLIRRHIPASSPDRDRQALEKAIEECLSNGLTSFQDAGSSQQVIDLMQAFAADHKLGIRLWVMLSGGDSTLLHDWYARGPMVDPEGKVTVRAIKLYADGALGNRGAWLLEPYTDRPGHMGNAVMDMDYVGKVAKEGLLNGFQVCTHAIGDRANREVMDRYEAAFEAYPDQARDHRFRIEHAQHLHPDDIPRFGSLGVIASMQAIHMSSDRPWAIDRLGKLRIIQGAYVWRKLLDSGAKVINGTDAPVEPVSPIASFYSSVTRRTLAGNPEGGYEPDQKMTRMEALRSYTLDAAYGAFEEEVKGSIEPGKLADFTILSQDILTVPEDDILKTQVAATIVGGEILYEAPGMNLALR